VSARSKWPHPFSPEELQQQIADAARLPDDEAHERELIAARDNVGHRSDALDVAELRALDRQLAAIERGRQLIGPVRELTADEIADAIEYLRLQQGAKRCAR
jgi:hypothetical protein